MKTSFRAILIVIGGIACISTVVAQDRNVAGSDALRGKELYYAHGCFACHGYNGETGASDLVGTKSPVIADVELFVTYLRLRADFAPLLPSTRMPNYSESVLSDTDARNIFAYVSTFELDAPDIEDTPALRAVLESAGRPSAD